MTTSLNNNYSGCSFNLKTQNNNAYTNDCRMPFNRLYQNNNLFTNQSVDHKNNHSVDKSAFSAKVKKAIKYHPLPKILPAYQNNNQSQINQQLKHLNNHHLQKPQQQKQLHKLLSKKLTLSPLQSHHDISSSLLNPTAQKFYKLKNYNIKPILDYDKQEKEEYDIQQQQQQLQLDLNNSQSNYQQQETCYIRTYGCKNKGNKENSSMDNNKNMAPTQQMSMNSTQLSSFSRMSLLTGNNQYYGSSRNEFNKQRQSYQDEVNQMLLTKSKMIYLPKNRLKSQKQLKYNNQNNTQFMTENTVMTELNKTKSDISMSTFFNNSKSRNKENGELLNSTRTKLLFKINRNKELMASCDKLKRADLFPLQRLFQKRSRKLNFRNKWYTQNTITRNQ